MINLYCCVSVTFRWHQSFADICSQLKNNRMRVFKFGGASVSSVERIQQVAAILQREEEGKLLIVISAMGKTTNALEKVADAFFHNKKEEALQLFQQIKQQHLTTAKYLLVTG